ncbi:oxygenase MpaB family protein [Siphonobacter curvatus]|uniref:DUF2236 domain-containing protein n=1 Tax=Siphonobacter curvatus TaxID=2094562 RepID=A0A2S7IPQ3_9BACT|nr:oxygenase MpaB family protein [Siphonobacter curvatus]PQA59703.1 DUF2236 domain-containing protein [Siphonobacter curvatus]
MLLRTIKPTRYFSDELLSHYRQQTDPAADAIIEQVAAAGGPAGVRTFLQQRTEGKIPLKEVPECRRFVREEGRLPDWADPKLMASGIRLFQRHRDTITLLLGCLSLPYAYLAADGVQVLALSKRMQNDTRQRLEETGAFVFGITEAEAWQGKYPTAIERILNVRLIHAVVRWFCQHSNRWNPAWGEPVNQEDMAGTNLTFSYIIIQGLRKNGIEPDEKEAEAYLHFWKVVGYLSGVPEDLLPENLREAYVLGQSIARRLFRPSPEGQQLTQALLRALEDTVPEGLKTLPAAQMRFLLGDEYADQLALPAVPLEKRLVRLLPMRIFFRP